MASSSRAPLRGGRAGGRGRRSDTWSWWMEVDAGRPGAGGGSRHWKCRHCGYERSGGAHKVRAHFLGESGHQVQFCSNLSEEKRRELQERAANLDALSAQRRAVRPVAVDPTAYATAHAAHAASEASSTPRVASCGLGSFSMPSSSSVPTRGRQSTLDGRWDAKRKEDVDVAVARFFYHDHIAFQAARSEYFKVMCKKIGEYGPSYTPPSSETLRTTLLDRERQAVEQAAQNTKNMWRTNGVTLITDGWSDTRRRSIHGIVAYSRGEMYFISSHDASGTGKSAAMLASEWTEGIEFVGRDIVLGFVVDGEASNRAAAAIIESMYPNITVSFCMAHCLNNLLKDIGKLSWVDPVIEKANHMVTYVLNHQFLRHEFSKKSSKQLLKYSETRYAYNFLMLGRLSTCSGALRQVFISDEFTTSPLATTQSGRECKENADDLTFWEDVRRIDAMVQPIMHLLRIIDAMQPCIGKVYEAMDRMIEKLKSYFSTEHCITIEEKNLMEARYEEIHALCIDRWNMYHSPMHAAAFVLDPEFQGHGQETDREVGAGWRCILQRLVPDQEERRVIKNSLAKYRSFQELYGSPDAQADRRKVGAALWWEDYGSDGPELQRLAIRILSQAASSSCLERLWSSYAHIASKKRNRLGTQKADDLVFVSANLRMLGKSAIGNADPFVEWEQQQEREQEGLDHEDEQLWEDREEDQHVMEENQEMPPRSRDEASTSYADVLEIPLR